MTKHTIEIFRDESFIQGYGWRNTPYTEEEVLDAVAKLCNEQDKKVYKHLIRYAEENVSNVLFYSPNTCRHDDMRIPYCHRVVYCDIWLQ
jgi:hypothetical protein